MNYLEILRGKHATFIFCHRKLNFTTDFSDLELTSSDLHILHLTPLLLFWLNILAKIIQIILNVSYTLCSVLNLLHPVNNQQIQLNQAIQNYHKLLL